MSLRIVLHLFLKWLSILRLIKMTEKKYFLFLQLIKHNRIFQMDLRTISSSEKTLNYFLVVWKSRNYNIDGQSRSYATEDLRKYEISVKHSIRYLKLTTEENLPKMLVGFFDLTQIKLQSKAIIRKIICSQNRAPYLFHHLITVEV